MQRALRVSGVRIADLRMKTNSSVIFLYSAVKLLGTVNSRLSVQLLTVDADFSQLELLLTTPAESSHEGLDVAGLAEIVDIEQLVIFQ